MDLNETIQNVKKSLVAKDSMGLRELSNTLSSEAAITQDSKTIDLAIITYALHKILSKIHFRDKHDPLMENVIMNLESKDFPTVMKLIDEFGTEHGRFEGGLIEKARVKIGSRLYARGMSLSQSASLVDTRKSDILDYIGVTKVHEHEPVRSVEDRMKVVRKLFKE